MSSRPFHLLTAVWGEAFIELFLDICVPNQLTPGNLGAMPPGSRYRVFTRQADVKRLLNCSELASVEQWLPVDVVAVPDLDSESGDR